MRRIGVLMAYAESDPVGQSEVAAFRDALAKLGWTEGRNLQIELRWSGGDADRIRMFAKELVDLQPDVILSARTQVTSAFPHETRTIPIVFVNVADPLTSGFAASLASPGGNITGFMMDISAQGGCWGIDQLWYDLHRVIPSSWRICRPYSQGRKARRSAGGAGHEVRTACNVKTAKTLGLTVPPSILIAADEVIE